MRTYYYRIALSSFARDADGISRGFKIFSAAYLRRFKVQNCVAHQLESFAGRGLDVELEKALAMVVALGENVPRVFPEISEIRYIHITNSSMPWDKLPQLRATTEGRTCRYEKIRCHRIIMENFSQRRPISSGYPRARARIQSPN